MSKELQKKLTLEDLENGEFEEPQGNAFIKIISGDAPLFVVLKSATDGEGKIGKDVNGVEKIGKKLIVETDIGTISTASKGFRFALKPFLAEMLKGKSPRIAITAKGEGYNKKYFVVGA